jgi:L-aminopeptidase/D-esterase-like protein
MLPYKRLSKGLTDIDGIRVGHASDYEALTGCTVILCERGAVGGVDIRGSATGTEELDLLSPGHVTERIHAVVLAGGSAFGLEAASGVRRYLERKGIGYPTSAAKVPLVPAAILYDLSIGKSDVRPTREMGEAAAAQASTEAVAEGCVGAGTGAVVGRVRGMSHAMKGGIGSSTVSLPGGVLVSALIANNSVGDVRDLATGKILAGTRRTPESREFANTAELLKTGQSKAAPRENTCLGVIATNARLTKVGAAKVAQMAHQGIARTIYPASTMSDGDVMFALSLGSLEAEVTALGIAAAEAVAQAVVRSVTLARSLGGVPGLAR